MKFVKRVISLFLVGILLASMGVTEVLAVERENKVTLVIEADKEEIRVGDTVTFTVSLKNIFPNGGTAKNIFCTLTEVSPLKRQTVHLPYKMYFR